MPLYHFESLQEQTTFVESGRTNKSRRRLARRRQIVTLWRWVMACRNAPVTSVPGLVSGGFLGGFKWMFRETLATPQTMGFLTKHDNFGCSGFGVPNFQNTLWNSLHEMSIDQKPSSARCCFPRGFKMPYGDENACRQHGVSRPK
jgi:hypothetical protein